MIFWLCDSLTSIFDMYGLDLTVISFDPMEILHCAKSRIYVCWMHDQTAEIVRAMPPPPCAMSSVTTVTWVI